MYDFEAEIAKINAAHDERSARLQALLASTDDLVSVVLRGHLVAEELLFAAVASFCRDPNQLAAARLRFPQLVALVRALQKIPAVPETYWDALLELNALRNSLAHTLEHPDLERRIARFIEAVRRASLESELPGPEAGREALTTAIHFLLGGLEVVALWHHALETFFTARALESRDSDAPGENAV